MNVRDALRRWLRTAALTAGVLIFLGVPSLAQNPPVTFTEGFSATTYMGESETVEGWGSGRVYLRKKIRIQDAATTIANKLYTSNMPKWMDTAVAADFTGDGKTDIVVTSSHFSNVLALYQNTAAAGNPAIYDASPLWLDGSAGSGGVPTFGVGGSMIDTAGYCGLTAGDYDADGDADFLYVCAQMSSPYTIKRVYLYSNRRIESGLMTFNRIDLTSTWAPILKGVAWSSTFMASVDFYLEGNLDIVIGNSLGEIYVATNLGESTLDSESFYLEPDPILSTGFTGRGASAVAAGDFDLDGDTDLFIGSVSHKELRYYKNTGVDLFAAPVIFKDDGNEMTDNQYDGGATAMICADFDGDGDLGVLVATDGANFRTAAKYIGGTVFYFDNREGTFIVTLKLDTRIGTEKSTVWTVPEGEQGLHTADFDYALLLDFNGDGFYDSCAFGDHAYDNPLTEGTMTVSCRGLLPSTYYNMAGTAYSGVIAPTRAYNQLVTKVLVKDIYMGWLDAKDTGLKVIFYVSNNGGLTWYEVHEYKDAEVKNHLGNIKEIKFTEFGSDLVWKAVMTASEDEGPNHLKDGFSLDSPYIDSITFVYTTLDGKEFSRSSPAATRIRPAVNTIRHVSIAASFQYPSLEGHVRAYDVTKMNFAGGDSYTLRTVSRMDVNSPTGRAIIPEDVSILWDAGELLKIRPAAGRTVYTAIRGGRELVRADFTTANVQALKKYIKDTGTHDGSLIEFIRGENRTWKLAWIDHSSPLVVGPPSGVPDLKGAGYAEFLEAQTTRADVVYVGDNGGMLHCFDANTGEENWAYVPFNQLPFLKKLAKKDKRTHSRYFNPKGLVFVDSSPVVEDVYIDADNDGTKEWTSLLISGQGRGTGKGTRIGSYHYFALDVTDPLNPRPLWEFSSEEHGETWSVPAMAKVLWQGETKWVAFVGTGKHAKDSLYLCRGLRDGRPPLAGEARRDRRPVFPEHLRHRQQRFCRPGLYRGPHGPSVANGPHGQSLEADQDLRRQEAAPDPDQAGRLDEPLDRRDDAPRLFRDGRLGHGPGRGQLQFHQPPRQGRAPGRMVPRQQG